VFVVSWVVASALQPGYSNLRDGVSGLSSREGAHAWIVTVGLACLGASIVLLGVAVTRVLDRRRALVLLPFVLTGVALLVTAFVPADCGFGPDDRCLHLWKAGQLTWREDVHEWAGFASMLVFLVTPYAIARALWPGTVAMAALVAGHLGVGVAVAEWLSFGFNDAGGLVERGGLGVLHLWSLIVGVGVLWVTRGPRPMSELIEFHPRDFFARSWHGHGELVLRPVWLGRFARQRFEAFREATWLSERLWRFDDSAHFGGGHVERRRTYGEFLSEDQIRMTAGDLPDGIDVQLEEGGFRVSEFRVAYPIGPVPVYVRVVDRSSLLPDGTFENRFDVYTPGVRIPLARLTFWVRPVDASEASASSSTAAALS
jgi:hypothetical protein